MAAKKTLSKTELIEKIASSASLTKSSASSAVNLVFDTIKSTLNRTANANVMSSHDYSKGSWPQDVRNCNSNSVYYVIMHALPVTIYRGSASIYCYSFKL